MHWINPSGAWALIALAVILCLYILKQRMEPIEVSSTFLWRKAIASLEADRPFQKLRRNLLMFLQLLLVLLLALSIMRPMTLGAQTGEVIFVMDLSASMQANSGNGTRLEAAIEDARGRLDGMPEGARVSILTAGRQVAQPLTRSGDLWAARRVLDSLAAENGSADIAGAMSLALALQRELSDVDLVVYTDQAQPEGDFTQPSVGVGVSNRAILSLNVAQTAAVARIANYGAEASVTVECYADGVLADLRNIDMARDEIVSVSFALPAPAEQVVARIVQPDALEIDNERTWVQRDAASTTVVLAGRDNIFIEKALALRSDIVLLKTTAEEAPQVAGGALTVLDGPLPDTLPEIGSLLLLDPDARVEALVEEPTTLTAAPGALADTLNAYVQVDEIQVMRYKPVVGGTPIWLANGQPVLSVFEEAGQKMAVLGFDLHEANLPLLKEFPVFMQQLLAYLVPEPLGFGATDAYAGSTLSIVPQSFARSAWVMTPSGRRVDIPVTGGVLQDTNEIGVYRLVQVDEEGAQTAIPFALHVPASESDIQTVAQGANQTARTGRATAYGREWTPWLVAALLIVMLLEWWVYRHGY